jgi:transketolase
MKMDKEKEIKLSAAKCRQNILRMIKANGSGHLGPAYSCIDIVAALYFYGMHVDPAAPNQKDRDIFLLSAGHKGMAQYAALAEAVFFLIKYSRHIRTVQVQGSGPSGYA